MFTRIMLIQVLVVLLSSCALPIGSPENGNTASTAGTNALLRLIQTIPLPNVAGRIDHLALDTQGQRLFIAALGNNSVEILDLRAGKVVHSILGLSEPQGILFIPELDRLFVANGGSGLCQAYDGSSFAEIGRVELSGDADNMRYDSHTRLLIIGYGDGALGFVNAESMKMVNTIALGGHPEAFQQEASSAKIFVNIPSMSQIAVVDQTQQKVITNWPMAEAAANYPLALDETHQRLFVGFRAPARLGVFDSETGRLAASLDSVGDVDDVFYDPARKIIFVIGGEGYVDLFSQQDADHYQRLGRIPTAAGARTGLWAPDLNRLYVAVPRQGVREAEIQVYALQRSP